MGFKKKNSRNLGHRAGLSVVENIIKATMKNKIKFLTLYAFSTENWKRPKKEVKYIFRLLEEFLKKKINEFHQNDIKLKIIGFKKFSKKLNDLLLKAERLTKNNKQLQVNLALNYGSKSEIVNSLKLINKKKILINEANIKKNLFTHEFPDPDILIRTGDTKRLSNFLLWQLAYSEIFFEKKLWPDFTEKDYNKIIKEFKNVKRNFGNV